MNALNFDVLEEEKVEKKLVKWQKYHHQKLGSDERGVRCKVQFTPFNFAQFWFSLQQWQILMVLQYWLLSVEDLKYPYAQSISVCCQCICTVTIP